MAARNQLADARGRLRQENAALTALRTGNVPPPNPLEAKVIGDQARVAEAQTRFDETRIRAPIAGTVLQITTRVGELAGPSDSPLVLMGDTSRMRVRAEVDERDVAKIRLGQGAVIRCETFPGRSFDGKVVEVAPLLALPTMNSRHQRQPSNVGVMTVLIDLEGSVPLLPGMRTDVYFRSEPAPFQAHAS